MCGIIGVASNRPIVDKLLLGLLRQEYRGYDSAGIASFNQKSIQVVKSEGKLSNLINKFNDLTKDDLYCDSYQQINKMK